MTAVCDSLTLVWNGNTEQMTRRGKLCGAGFFFLASTYAREDAKAAANVMLIFFLASHANAQWCSLRKRPHSAWLGPFVKFVFQYLPIGGQGSKRKVSKAANQQTGPTPIPMRTKERTGVSNGPNGIAL